MTKLFHRNLLTKLYYDEQIVLLVHENHYCLITSLHNFCRNNEHCTQLFRRCLNTYGDQRKLEEHMLRNFEQKVCNKSYMRPNQKIKFNDWYMKKDPPRWIAADFECMNIPINDNNNNNDNDNDNVNDHDNNGVADKLFVNVPGKKNYPTNRTNVYHIDDIWSLDILDLEDYGHKVIEDIDMF